MSEDAKNDKEGKMFGRDVDMECWCTSNSSHK